MHIFKISKKNPIQIQQTFQKYAVLVAKATVIGNEGGNAIFKIIQSSVLGAKVLPKLKLHFLAVFVNSNLFVFF